MYRYLRSDQTTNDMMNAMIESMDDQKDPLVGSFWYDPDNEELFGVASEPADTAKCYKSEFGENTKTGRRLHEQIWQKEFHKGKDKRFQGDYTQVPRGRVFQVGDEFVVMVGDWINEYPQAKEDILYEFQLPESTIFKEDIHCNIGHGWSDELK